MGGDSSKSSPPLFHPPSRRPPPPPPPPSPRFSKPWRTLSWGDNEEDHQYAEFYQPGHKVTHLRVLLYGPVGAGKSSFINSVSTALRQKVSSKAGTGTTTSVEGQSFTRRYTTHWIKRRDESKYNLIFNDIMGFEEGSGRGVHVEDIKLALEGHVKEKHQFNPMSPLSSDDPDYVPSPSLNDKVHVLVCVCSANASEIKDSVLQKMKEIREKASMLGIPQLLIVTKVDEACPVTKADLRDVYRSKHVKKKMEEFSSKVGIPMNHILPVTNYIYEINPSEDIDTLILSVLRTIIDLGEEFLDKL